MLNENDLRNYFLHGWDVDRGKILMFSAVTYFNFHQGFWFGRNSPFLDVPMSRILNLSWYVYELSGAMLNCAICHAATGQLSKSKNVLPFSTHEFQPVAIGIRNAMRKYLDNPELDEERLFDLAQPHGFVDSPQVAQYAPCVPDGSSQGFYYSGETPSGFQPQPEYHDHIPPESHSYGEETLDHRDLPPLMQYDLQHNNHFNFTSGSSAGWGASEGSSSFEGALLP
ncbi:uncharacterized protein EDB91DRAFT_1079682 [Suillus paluster]|uniref:uncharacterized protein n=1 Tax=Suillus paluster TaxID=48578 RepID=UPI001B870DAF|nr:uncharacterized protein EDB91DRAFT_1079682 [Suillus paluster]KAG1747044.1 hypothetical protein EDB91DRAFT_1079682 [Suillus paluster]